MTFQKKTSEGAEKNEKKVSESDTKLRKELFEKDKELEELRRKVDELDTLAQKPIPQTTTAPDMDFIQRLQGQIDQLSRQVQGQGTRITDGKLTFRKPTSDDVIPMEKAITFTARSVIYIVASYVDSQGLEQLPPFKLIIFQYAASDIRKEGREEEIKNFSQFTTNLQPEIDFLRAHPLYGITFSENTNEMMNEDIKEMQFKERAALALGAAPPEAVMEQAKSLGIPNWTKKSANELKPLIVHELSKRYKHEAQELQDNILRRQALGNLVMNEKE